MLQDTVPGRFEQFRPPEAVVYSTDGILYIFHRDSSCTPCGDMDSSRGQHECIRLHHGPEADKKRCIVVCRTEELE